ncbi:MAG: nucleotide exchange factor GrpE [Eggerthellaceae bacterium]|nr:nucleotide exchange factor GrpE [Eggerthellaceae bacterium]
MAKFNDEDVEKGFQIPIEDAAEEQVAEEAAQEETEPAAEEEPAEEADIEAEAEAEAETDEFDEEDLINEAETIVEEAAEAEAADKAQADAKEWQDRYMRLHAEWDTYRRRMQEQRAEEKVRAAEKLMENLLPVLDDFERTVAYANENGEAGLLDGVKAVQTKLIDALKKGGLEVIDPVGEAYNALEAQAVQVVPDEEAYEETVKDVFQKGYKMGRKVLRAAMVTITSGGPKRPKDEESEEE